MTKKQTTIEKGTEIIKLDYPDLEINIARDGGDVVEFLLYDIKDYKYANCLIASYNQWYPQEMLYFKFDSIS